MPPAQRISRALKRLSLSVWDAITGCCGMSECLDEPLLGAKVSRGRSYAQRPRRYSVKKRSYLRADTASPSPTRFRNPFDDDALNRETPSTLQQQQQQEEPTVQDSATELALSTPFKNYKNQAFDNDDRRAPPLF